ncbi:SapC family protein [Novosphingobium rosa]|uniref:SapC family protein n=1 Tax=Novosphingobium rosa TaxID=76978 RepID=UPI0008317B16|nr:SapC family protein [Novosphingobium rosa]
MAYINQSVFTQVEGVAAQAAPPPAPSYRVNLPLYGDPHPVTSATHGGVGVLADAADYSFAAHAPLIPLAADEFERAALDYPIVFIGTAHQPYAVTGLDPQRNLFIRNGFYRADAYVPAYLRRYPFAFVRVQGMAGPLLYIDHASRRVAPLGTPGAAPLFHGAAPTELTRQALGFCDSYQAGQARSLLVLELLAAYNLLEPKTAARTPPGASAPQLLLEYFSISPERLEALPDADFLMLRRAGVLPALHAQIASQQNWAALAAVARATA